MRWSVLGLLWCAFVFAQDAIQTTPCEVAANPPAFNQKLVTVRSPVMIEFEGSGFDVNCENDVYSHHTWITFGGDVEIPIIYCCGNHKRKAGVTISVEGIKVPLKKDDEFKKFFRLLTAVRKTAPTGVPCFYDCYQYHVTATLTGLFLAGTEWHRPDDGKVFYMGYGHLGCCSLFVIQKVAEVESQPTGIPIGNKFDCSHAVQQLAIDHSAVIAQQRAVLNQTIPSPDESQIGERLIRDQMRSTHEEFDSGDHTIDYEGKFEQEKMATYIWLAKDKLTSYSVRFERFDWLSPYAKRIDDRIWTAVKIERSECKQ